MVLYANQNSLLHFFTRRSRFKIGTRFLDASDRLECDFQRPIRIFHKGMLLHSTLPIKADEMCFKTYMNFMN